MLEDLTTSFVAYVESRRDASTLPVLDSDTEVFLHQPTVRAAVASDDDLNTAYALFLG